MFGVVGFLSFLVGVGAYCESAYHSFSVWLLGGVFVFFFMGIRA